jgi:hypothetical protein
MLFVVTFYVEIILFTWDIMNKIKKLKYHVALSQQRNLMDNVNILYRCVALWSLIMLFTKHITHWNNAGNQISFQSIQAGTSAPTEVSVLTGRQTQKT